MSAVAMCEVPGDSNQRSTLTCGIDSRVERACCSITYSSFPRALYWQLAATNGCRHVTATVVSCCSIVTAVFVPAVHGMLAHTSSVCVDKGGIVHLSVNRL